MKSKKNKLSNQLQIDFWEDTINIRNCVFGRDCKQFWERLIETTIPNLKYCKKCERNVYMIENDDQVANAIRLNQCIAIKTQSELKLI